MVQRMDSNEMAKKIMEIHRLEKESFEGPDLSIDDVLKVSEKWRLVTGGWLRGTEKLEEDLKTDLDSTRVIDPDMK